MAIVYTSKIPVWVHGFLVLINNVIVLKYDVGQITCIIRMAQ